MAISDKDVLYTANLARIRLEARELAGLSADLEEIVGFIDKLKALNVKDVPPTSHILPLGNVFRRDSVCSSLSVEQALQNTKNKDQGFFKVPQVVVKE